jgi:hypothetical protein
VFARFRQRDHAGRSGSRLVHIRNGYRAQRPEATETRVRWLI